MKLLAFLEDAPYPATTFLYNKKRYNGRFAPAAAVHFLRPDELMLFLTQEALDRIFPDLQAELPSDLKVTPILIPSGANQQELSIIAQTINQSVSDTDEVAFDLSHGPLSFPLIGMVVLIFMTATREIAIRAILFASYGVDRGVDPGETPIFDLTSLLAWVRWFIAADHFNHSGDASDLIAVVRQKRMIMARAARGDKETLSQLGSLGKLAGVLDGISKSLHMIRPHQAMQQISDLPDRVQAASQVLERSQAALPYTPLLDRIVENYEPLAQAEPNSKENVCATLQVERRMINWYVQRELWVEAATLAREWLVNWVMFRLGLTDFTNLTLRQRVENVLGSEARDFYVAKRTKEPYRTIFLKDLQQVETILSLWSDLTDVRNDINHAGMRRKPNKPETLMRRIQGCINTLNDLPIDR
jgi:hypothetical protein